MGMKCEEKEQARPTSVIDCACCKYAILLEPKGFENFREVAGIYGVFDALSICDFDCAKGKFKNARNIK